jgi:ABC-2 type transport system permease protein
MHDFRRNLYGVLFWTLTITILIILTMSAFKVFQSNQSKIFGLLNILPKGVLQFKGVSNPADLLNVLGFYAVNNVIYMMVLGSIYSIVLASNILLREEYDKTAEFLLTRPLDRDEIFVSKLLLVICNTLIINIITTAAGLISLFIIKNEKFNISAFFILSTYTFLLNIMFGGVGIFISTLVKRAKSVTTFSIGLVMIFYFIHTISKISSKLGWLGYLSPYHYVDMNILGDNYSFAPLNLLFFTSLFSICTFISFRIYLKKDILL